MSAVKQAPECRAGCAVDNAGAPNCPPGWMPSGTDRCSAACAKVFKPFWQRCGKMFTESGMGGMDKLGAFNRHCQAAAVHYISKNCTMYDGKHGTWPTLRDKSARAKECCAPGETWNGVAHSKCTLCTPGQYDHDSDAATPCQYCPSGRFSNTVGAVKCRSVPCTSGGEYSGAGATSMSAVCIRCPMGKYDDDGNPATACHDCPVGQYTHTTGATSDVSCTPCPPGTFSGNTFSAVGATTMSAVCIKCLMGKYDDDRNAASPCQDCPAGQYSNTTGATSCTPCRWSDGRNMGDPLCPCNAGTHKTFSNSGITVQWYCVKCAPGQYDHDHNPTTSCRDCPAGQYSITQGATSCTRCAPGTWVPRFSGNAGASNSCFKCAPGQYDHDRNPTTLCQDCPAGQYGNTQGATSCTPCAPGRFSGNTGPSTPFVCATCKEGSYDHDSDAATPCLDCPSGRFSNTVGAVKCRSVPCASGGEYSADPGATSMSAVCIRCPIGRYDDDGNPATACHDCPVGQYTHTTGATSDVSCTPCPPGTFSGNTFSAVGATTMSAVCIKCPMGKYDDDRNAASPCQDCLAGQYSNTTGATSCIPCAPGVVSAAGAFRCIKCLGAAKSTRTLCQGITNGTELMCHAAVCEYRYTGINGTSVSNLISSIKYPNSPDSVRPVRKGVFQIDMEGHNWGAMIEGFVVAPASGDYTFLTYSDSSHSGNFVTVWAATQENTQAKLAKVVEVHNASKAHTSRGLRVTGSVRVSWTVNNTYYLRALIKKGEEVRPRCVDDDGKVARLHAVWSLETSTCARVAATRRGCKMPGVADVCQCSCNVSSARLLQLPACKDVRPDCRNLIISSSSSSWCDGAGQCDLTCKYCKVNLTAGRYFRVGMQLVGGKEYYPLPITMFQKPTVPCRPGTYALAGSSKCRQCKSQIHAHEMDVAIFWAKFTQCNGDPLNSRIFCSRPQPRRRGCTDSRASNFDACASIDSGTCEYTCRTLDMAVARNCRCYIFDPITKLWPDKTDLHNHTYTSYS
eukprot:COSAG01_NODE_1157_length_11476_cov_87.701503_1_plen_1017_part_10